VSCCAIGEGDVIALLSQAHLLCKRLYRASHSLRWQRANPQDHFLAPRKSSGPGWGCPNTQLSLHTHTHTHTHTQEQQEPCWLVSYACHSLSSATSDLGTLRLSLSLRAMGTVHVLGPVPEGPFPYPFSSVFSSKTIGLCIRSRI
jgi:hypothetical protein